MVAAAVYSCVVVICLVLFLKVALFVLGCLTIKKRYNASPIPGPKSSGGLLGG